MLTSLTIKGKRIKLIPLETGEEVWIIPPIFTAHRDRDGLQISLRKQIVNVLKQRPVKFLIFNVPEFNLEFQITPQEFLKRAKIKPMPSIFNGNEGYYFPIYEKLKR